jgi:hypothetical protein
MIKPISVRAFPGYRIYISFSDGAEGIVDLSDLLGQGVFEAWNDPSFFSAVHIGPGRQIQWSDDIELCPDTVYMKLTGKSAEELFPELRRQDTHAGS